MSRTTRSATSSPTSSGETASRCCSRWASTRSGCPPRTRRSRTVATRARSPSGTSRRSAPRCAAWAGRSTGSARSPPHEPDYYRWTQWLFLQLYEQGSPTGRRRQSTGVPTIRPCSPTSRSSTGAAGAAARLVEARNMEQWFFKITAYADALLDDLATIDWPERTMRCSATGSVARRASRSLSRIDGLDARHPGLHHAAGHALRRDVLRARPGASAGRAARRGPREADEVLLREPSRPPTDIERAATAAREDGRLHRRASRPTRSTASRSRSGSPTTC